MKKLFLALGMTCALSASAQNFNGYIVKLKPGFESLVNTNMADAQVRKLSFGTFAVVKQNFEGLVQDPAVEYVEKNWIINLNDFSAPQHNDASLTENRDEQFSKQWGLMNDGRNSSGWFSRGKAGEDINATAAWNVETGDRDLVVAVIDTGVDYTHADLKANTWKNEGEIAGNGIDDDGNGFVDDVYGYDFANKDGDPMDGHSHGTHCAGVIGARHNGTGIMGVMANVKIMSIKFLSDSGSGETIDAISSIDYAVANGAKILSNSWGGGEYSEALKESIQNARDKGVLFVAAAGNSSADNDARPTYPANYDVENVITVGAMDGKGNRSSFSNYGQDTVHVFAPGSNILSTVPGDRYKKMSGTSMATPMVSGVLGLLLSKEEGLTFSQIKERIYSTSVPNAGLITKAKSGRIEAYRLLNNIQN
ncbi:S8 family peptidase [Halobacteriovorax sp. DA5]|uniref:S8 family peptidase n=1 Tax=Halobacteriovorax sp. DA5 TaxID=2067553 RepID=UPI000CD28567|nr:S8 family peptidase [Halobacteriovorax sp. DA5]POB14709.1 subtilase [Halobacteriovorax sp. DA5]